MILPTRKEVLHELQDDTDTYMCYFSKQDKIIKCKIFCWVNSTN